ncbi:PAS domain S-box protein [Williamsia sp. MIQD14]|uniref:sensor domain-containing protein n=1 Tax=Williamsia sp. MIQD14 TaxID=3425703 RepID=UPI003DA11669
MTSPGSPVAAGAAPWTTPELESMAARVLGRVPVTEFGVIVSGADGRFIAATPAAADILGLSVEQLLGRTIVDQRWSAITVDGDPVASDELPANTTLRTGRPQSGVLIGVQRGSDAAGEHSWLRVDTHMLPHDEPRPPGAVLSCFSVIDGPRAAELRLAQSERTFRMITERSHEVVGIHGLDGTWLWASPAAGRVFGRLPAELLGTNVFDLIHADDIGAANAALVALLDGAEPVTVTVRIWRADGAVLWAEVIGQLIRDRRGRPHQLQSSFREVTARIEAEQARDAAVEVFRTVMASSPIGMALRGVDGRVRRTNVALQEMLGATDADLVGTTLLDRVHGDDRDTVETAIAAGVPDAVGSAYEARLLRADGSTVWVDATSVVLRGVDGSPSAVLEQLHDITTRKIAEADLLRRAISDPLTGLLNRTRFTELLGAALDDARGGGPEVTVLFCDVDRFKSVNDTRGHAVGDELLRAVAGALTDVAGPGDTVARYGGDEFAILTRTSADDVARMTARIRAADTGASEPLTISVGVASSRSAEPEDLLRDADQAMYLAKQTRDSAEATGSVAGG